MKTIKLYNFNELDYSEQKYVLLCFDYTWLDLTKYEDDIQIKNFGISIGEIYNNSSFDIKEFYTKKLGVNIKTLRKEAVKYLEMPKYRNYIYTKEMLKKLEYSSLSKKEKYLYPEITKFICKLDVAVRNTEKYLKKSIIQDLKKSEDLWFFSNGIRFIEPVKFV